MNFPDKKTIETLRTQFPVGCRVVLDRMEDAQAPALGTQGTCRGVDDAGNVMVSWDTGGSLNVAYGADSCHRVASEAWVQKRCRYMLSQMSHPIRFPHRNGSVHGRCLRL